MKTHKTLILLFCLCLVFDTGVSKEMKNIRSAVIAEIKKYPDLSVQDLYKLAYQAAMGNEHMMAETSKLQKYLENELASIDASTEEPLIEYLTSDSTIARVNLRPFKARNGNPKKLIEAMVNTRSTFKPSIEILRTYLHDIETLSIENSIPFQIKDISDYFRQMELKGFHAVHHSKTVEGNYRPAYRIVAGDQISFQ